jgi:hypothetical protein
MRRCSGQCAVEFSVPAPEEKDLKVSAVPVQMWRKGRAVSLRRCGRGEPSPGADVAGVGPVPARMSQMWQG